MTVRVDGVEVRLAALTGPEAEGSAAEDAALLSPDERRRAERFAFDEPRRRFIRSRGLLRRALAGVLGGNAGEIPLVDDRLGKPRLADGSGDLRFNVSHSAGLWALALTRGREVGVDVEEVRLDRDLEGIAARFFSAAENGVLRSLPPADRAAAFYRCWTRKEAWLKARGFGLRVPLDSFDVSLAPGDPPAVLRSRAEPDEPARWVLHALHPGPGFEGCVAVERA